MRSDNKFKDQEFHDRMDRIIGGACWGVLVVCVIMFWCGDWR